MTNQQITQKPQDLIEMRNLMKDYAIMLTAPFAVAVLHYGIKAIFFALISVVTCIICRRVGEKILGCEFSSRDFSSLVIGVSLALLMPSTAQWWMVVSGAAFAIVVCVLPFGKTANSPFVPVAAATSFVTLCWPEKMSEFSQAGLSLSKMLTQGNSIGNNAVAFFEALTGSVPSAIGAGCGIALLGALVFFAIRNPKNALPAGTFLLAVVIMAILFPRVSTGRFVSVIMELCAGKMIFSAVFFMTYPSVLPKRMVARGLWGFAGGVVCMLMRYFGALEEPVCFGVLIACACAELADKIPLTKKEKASKEQIKEEVEVVETVVPEEVLSEIPDAPEVLEETEEIAEEVEVEAVTVESESLETVVSEENTINETENVFNIGGDGDE